MVKAPLGKRIIAPFSKESHYECVLFGCNMFFFLVFFLVFFLRWKGRVQYGEVAVGGCLVVKAMMAICWE